MPALNAEEMQQLPELLPIAIRWVEKHVAILMKDGLALTARGKQVARKVGVQHPERVRVMIVTQMPKLEDPRLRELGRKVKYLNDDDGTTFGYGIYIRKGCESDLELLAHELNHVAQCERLGGIEGFVQQYCRELAEYEYSDATMEREARDNARPFHGMIVEPVPTVSPVAVLCSAILMVVGIYFVGTLLSKGLKA